MKFNFISIHKTYIQDPRAKDLGAQSLTQVFNKLDINNEILDTNNVHNYLSTIRGVFTIIFKTMLDVNNVHKE